MEHYSAREFFGGLANTVSAKSVNPRRERVKVSCYLKWEGETVFVALNFGHKCGECVVKYKYDKGSKYGGVVGPLEKSVEYSKAKEAVGKYSDGRAGVASGRLLDRNHFAIDIVKGLGGLERAANKITQAIPDPEEIPLIGSREAGGDYDQSAENDRELEERE